MDHTDLGRSDWDLDSKVVEKFRNQWLKLDFKLTCLGHGYLLIWSWRCHFKEVEGENLCSYSGWTSLHFICRRIEVIAHALFSVSVAHCLKQVSFFFSFFLSFFSSRIVHVSCFCHSVMHDNQRLKNLLLYFFPSPFFFISKIMLFERRASSKTTPKNYKLRFKRSKKI